jgi:hypothetical protein
VLPHTIKVVLLFTLRKRFGEGVNKRGSIGSRVIVERMVAVNVGKGVFVGGSCVSPSASVVEGSAVLITNKFGVFVGCKENGVAVGLGDATGAGVCKNGMESGNPLQPVRREINKKKYLNLFITPLP